MASIISGAVLSPISKYKISRRGKKLQATDDQRTLIALPKDVPERTWAEVLQKEDTDLFIFEIREDIVEEAVKICYDRYMERQNPAFTAHCAAQAWLKLIDWQFYRHDPGEDPSAYPPCYIPKRNESWVPDELPATSPKDTWSRQELNVVEEPPDELLLKRPSARSLDVPVIEQIPSEYWFPGKVKVADHLRRQPVEIEESPGVVEAARRAGRNKKPLLIASMVSGVWDHVQESDSDATRQSEELGNESEVLQKVTDYSTEELSAKESTYSALKNTTPVDWYLHGAGDSTVDRLRSAKRRHSDKSRMISRHSFARSRNALLPLDDSRSPMNIISDCRLRNLRLDTQYEISSEKVDSPPGETSKRKT